MLEDSDDLESGLLAAIKFHKGKNPSKGTVAKWIKANGVGVTVSGSDESDIQRRAKAQHVLEKHKLLDCRELLRATLGATPTLSRMADQEKALYKEIFMNDMHESQEIMQPLKTIEENYENESPIHGKMSSSNKENVVFGKRPMFHETPQHQIMAMEHMAKEQDEMNHLLVHEPEIAKVERILFHSDSNDIPASPRSNGDMTSCDDNKFSFVTQAPLQPREDRTPVAKGDGQKEIAETVERLEFLVKNEIDICEERTRMVELLDNFKYLLRNYKENSKLELLRSHMKAQEQRRDATVSVGRMARDFMPDSGIDKLVSGIKRIRTETPETFKIATDYRSDVYKRREPLQQMPTNFSPYHPSSYFPQTIRTTVISSQKVREEPPRSIDISVLKKHNFSVDLISAFH